MAWFRAARFGMFIHWGLYAQLGRHEWVMNRERIPVAEYEKLAATWHPKPNAARTWARLAKRAGMRYMVMTTKHHEGFCLWDSRYTDYKAPNTAAGRDLLRPALDAFRAEGLRTGVYYSLIDWHHPQFVIDNRTGPYRGLSDAERAAMNQNRQMSKYAAYMRNQVTELLTRYGPIDVLWLDGGQVRPPAQDIRMDEIAALARRHQPGLIVADRTVGGANENFITPEQEIPDAPLGVPWESCITLGTGWKYNPRNVYKPVGQVIRMLAETVSKGGNLLLGVGPSPEGEIPAEDEKRLREIGAWLAVNGDAIYRTRPVAPYQEGNVRFTRRGDAVYAILLPGADGRAPERIDLASFRPADGSEVTLLDGARPVQWQPRGAGCTLALPHPLPPAPAWCFRLHPGGAAAGLAS